MKAKSIKRSEAETRNNEWTKLSPPQQLEYLNTHGLVAAKQHKKLEKKMVS